MRLFLLTMLLALTSCAPDFDQVLGGIDACDDLPDAWRRFAEAHAECQQADDCALVGGTGTCECAPGLFMYAINRGALTEARPYLTRFESDECTTFRARTASCDEPAYEATCVQGVCGLNVVGCCFGCDDGDADAGADGPDLRPPGPPCDGATPPDEGVAIDQGT